MKRIDTVIGYHQSTKHHFHRYARSSGYLDWANQPDPFRRYAGSTLCCLPFRKDDASPPYERLFSPEPVMSSPVDARTVGSFFECSLAISAWKQYQGERWALRCNPSSGNLHPTEGYLVAGAVEGLSGQPGVFHYAPKEHALEQRLAIQPELWQKLSSDFPPGTFFAGLTSIHWREAWKYGERAYRYCQHDAGHALAALRLSAALLGWRMTLLDGMADADVAALLGVDRDDGCHPMERERPDLLVAVHGAGTTPARLPHDVIAAIAAGPWRGTANQLSKEHVEWSIIDAVAAACEKPATEEPPRLPPASTAPVHPPSFGMPAFHVIRQRRSAVAMDGKTRIPREVFFGMLTRAVPSLTPVPWDVWPYPPRVHLGLFVHRVDGVAPGLYALARDPAGLEPLRNAMDGSFVWDRPPGCPPELSLFLLAAGDCREAAATVSCGQDIAGDGAFSLGMFAEFESVLGEQDPWMYPRLFWETGMIGQVLYLEAEAAGVRATGIGCFFDDAVHQLFGLQGRRYQSLYHFTVGGPVDDPRLTTLPPYPDR